MIIYLTSTRFTCVCSNKRKSKRERCVCCYKVLKLDLEQLIDLADSDKDIDKIKKFLRYVSNNKEKIVNYRTRQKEGLVFTSNLAESTVESLINQRCKGQQHMRWSREGLNPVLQLRAAIHSNDWQIKWKDVVLNAA